MARRSDTKSGLGKRISILLDAESKQSRTKLDKKPHFVPLDMSVLEVSLGHILTKTQLEEFHNKLISNIRNTKFTIYSYTKLQNTSATIIRTELKKGPIIIEYNNNIIGALFNSYGATGSNLFTPIINKTLSEFGSFDIGHLVSTSKLAKSPLQLTLEEVKGALSVYSQSKNRTKIDTHIANKIAIYLLTLYKTEKGKELVKKELVKYGITKDIDKIMSNPDQVVSVIKQNLKRDTLNLLKSSNIKAFEYYSGKVDAAYNALLEKSRYGSTIINIDIIKIVSSALSKINANIVIVQERKENQLEYGNRIEQAIANEVRYGVIPDLLADERFSPSFKEELATLVVNTVIGKTTKTVRKSKSIKIDGSLPKEKNVTRGQKTTAKVTGTLPKLRASTGQFTSVAALQALILAGLYERIKKNMQEPALVFRTGRFASSVTLNALTRDRNGTLLAFLTYMKYPYETFEPGFAQGSIARSPRLLIDKSVREIAVGLTTTRLRTIVV